MNPAPVLETNPKKICNKKINFPNQNGERIKALFNPLYIHNWEFGRKPSCTKNMYTSRFLHTSPSPGPSKMVLFLIFDKRLEVSDSHFSIDGQTLLTKLGGWVSGGQTLHWVLVSILATSQVIFKISLNFSYSRCCQFCHG